MLIEDTIATTQRFTQFTYGKRKYRKFNKAGLMHLRFFNIYDPKGIQLRMSFESIEYKQKECLCSHTIRSSRL